MYLDIESPRAGCRREFRGWRGEFGWSFEPKRAVVDVSLDSKSD
jgi:hypothetical protein